MSFKLITVAVCSTPTEARIIRNHLESHGIRAMVANDEVVGMSYHFGPALGGVQVQVPEADVQDAEIILQRRPGDGHEDLDSIASQSDADWDVDERRVAMDDSSFITDDEDYSIDDDEDLRSEEEKQLDDQVTRAYRASIIGIFFWPLLLYTFWLLIQVTRQSLPLNAKQKRMAWCAGIISGITIIPLSTLGILLPLL